MKVLDLHCPQGHLFEGWFASEDDFQNQLERKLVLCPVCGDSSITKRLSAPRLNLGARPPQASPPAAVPPATVSAQGASPSAQTLEQLQAMQAAWLQWSRKVAEQTEDVGEHFADEARRMHYGEIDERAIRGQASPEQAMALLDEGIAVVPLALPEGSKEKLQ
ncbi:DUF1178 family protein [Delftia sp. PS-11]|uniref:DUF1178 family protein n=1 Tax=Delftia sp. PS-11 TaxID=2767222 RepID=UPI002457CCB3|nr:DUF1178 family protein [Delftia sp. PS-11]KAJ8745176.1 DUF1178 family protein [Delftia sp. PS-11]